LKLNLKDLKLSVRDKKCFCLPGSPYNIKIA